MKKIVAIVIASLVIISCSNDPKILEGKVSDKKHRAAWVEDTSYCAMRNKYGVCTYTVRQSAYHDEKWEVKVVAEIENKKYSAWKNVSQEYWDCLNLGSVWQEGGVCNE